MKFAAVSFALVASLGSGILAGAASVGCSPAASPAPEDPTTTLVVAPAAERTAGVPADEPSASTATTAPMGTATEAPDSAATSTIGVGPVPPLATPPPRGGRPGRQTTPPMRLSTLARAVTVKWAVKVGRTTFRTTMAQVGDTIVIGTHGSTLAGLNERDDGVYVLEAKSGVVRTTIATPGNGDRDVGGVAVDGNRVYFTTDNGQLVAATLGGQILWKVALHGKVRPAPTLADLDGDGLVDVVVGDELGFLTAFEGKTGRRLWQRSTSANWFGARGFVGGAAITDVDGDGKDDVVAGGRDGALVAYRGRDGQVLWSVLGSSGMHASPTVLDADGDGRVEVLAAWSYGDVQLLDAKTGSSRPDSKPLSGGY